jgi:hypothetical protein
VIITGCGKVAEPGTPEWTVQAASKAALRKDWGKYVTFFTEDSQRIEVASCLSTILTDETARRLARQEGPQSVAMVNAMLGDDSAFKKKYGIAQEWLDEVDALESDDEWNRQMEFAEKVEDPAAMWKDYIVHETARDADLAPLRWGKIDKVETKDDTAVVHTYTAGFGRPRAYAVDLRKENGEWKIVEK